MSSSLLLLNAALPACGRFCSIGCCLPGVIRASLAGRVRAATRTALALGRCRLHDDVADADLALGVQAVPLLGAAASARPPQTGGSRRGGDPVAKPPEGRTPLRSVASGAPSGGRPWARSEPAMNQGTLQAQGAPRTPLCVHVRRGTTLSNAASDTEGGSALGPSPPCKRGAHFWRGSQTLRGQDPDTTPTPGSRSKTL